MTTTTTLPVTANDGDRHAARFVLWGGLAGMLIALAITFVSALLYGQSQGMSAGSCVVFGCMFTLILSQITGLPGMMAGAIVGGLTGGVVYRLRLGRHEA